MINFSTKKSSWNIKKTINRNTDASYLKKFNQAVLNLELNLQEERINTPFKA